MVAEDRRIRVGSVRAFYTPIRARDFADVSRREGTRTFVTTMLLTMA